jgi:ABC-type transport system involved in multi-copper enzyme maturation permease subunit
MLENPILTKELRTRMRGARAFWILFAYTGLLALFLFFAYLSWWKTQRQYVNYGVGYGGPAAFQVGRMFYGVLFTVQAVLVGLITPSLTAGGISIEKEQRTFEMLTASLLSRSAIVSGKLLAAVAFVALLLTSSLPLVSLCFLLGGVSPGEVASAYVLLLVCAFLYGAVGVACSSVARSTASSTMSAFGVIGFLFCASLPLSLMASAGFYMGGMSGGPTAMGISALNPIGAVTAGTAREVYFGVSVPAWVTGVVLNGLLGVIFALSAAHRLEHPRGDRSGILRLLAALYVGLLAFCLFGMLLPGSGARGAMFGSMSLYTLGFAAPVTVWAPCLWAPIFCTGDGLPLRGGMWGSFLDPRRLRRGEAPSGLLFTLLLALLCGAILLLGARFGPGATRFAASAGPKRDYILLLLSLTWGFGALGVLLSALLKNRWAALALTGAVMLLLYILPPLGLAAQDITGTRRPSVWNNIAYLSPLPATAELTSEDSRRAMWRNVLPQVMFAGGTPFRRVTPAVYGVLGLVFLVAAGTVDIKARRRHFTRQG